MEIFIIVIVSILAYQLFTTVAYIISDENEDTLVTIACGLWKFVVLFVCTIIRKILLLHARKYNLYQFFGNCSESKYDTKSDKWITNYFMTPEVAAQFRQVTKDDVPIDYCIRLLRTGKEFKNVPMKSAILTQEKIDAGVPGMTAEFLKKFKEVK